MSRRLLNSLVVTFARLGDGSVILSRPGETLIPLGEKTLNPSPAGAAQNLHLRRGLAIVRAGIDTYLDKASSVRVNGLFHAVFDNASDDLLRCDEDNIYKRGGGGTWSVLGGSALTGGANDVWAGDMVAKSGGTSPGNQFFLCNGVDAMYSFQQGAVAVASVAAATFTGAKVILGIGGRCLAMNVKDSGGNRRSLRVMRSIVGDPTNFTGTGSGFDDLTDDPLPIAAANIVAGRVVVYKGNEFGGSIVVGTPTGLVNAPFRWDTVRGTGILLPRSLVQLGPGINFFVGHDGFYLHDGGRNLRPILEESAVDILSRININARQNAWSVYDPVQRELYLAIPTGSSSTPTEVWVIDMVGRRLYGPHVYSGTTLTAATRWQPGTTITWDTLPLPSWDTLPYASWDTIGTTAGAAAFVFGADDGNTFTDNAGGALDDNGVSIAAVWESPTFIPEKQDIIIAPQQFREVRPHDRFCCQEVSVRFEDHGAWTPVVSVSTDDGTSWQTISNGASIGGSGTGAVYSATYHARINGNSFRLRVTGTRLMYLHSASMELTYAGDERHY